MAESKKKFPDMKAGSPDDFQTEDAALDYIVPFIPKGTGLIWEPASGQQNLVSGLRYRGFEVIGTDIKTGQDFMDTNLACDMILTNPPFSIKEKFLGRCYNLGKPFALLLPVSVFDAVDRRALFRDFHTEFIFPPRRVNFETPNHAANVAAGKKTSAWFYSIWVTHKLGIGRENTFL